MAAEDISLKSIAASLKRWAAHGLEHDNPDHIAAYRLARQSHKRPRVDQVIAILESQKTEHRSGARMSREFVLAPRSNFPKGLPAALMEWTVSEEALRDSQDVPIDSDFTTVYIFDGNVPRSALGKQAGLQHSISHSNADKIQ